MRQWAFHGILVILHLVFWIEVGTNVINHCLHHFPAKLHFLREWHDFSLDKLDLFFILVVEPFALIEIFWEKIFLSVKRKEELHLCKIVLMRFFRLFEVVIPDHFWSPPGHVLKFSWSFCVAQWDVIWELDILVLIGIAENVVSVSVHFVGDFFPQVFLKVVILWLISGRFVPLHKLTVGELPFQ